jgi:membrane protein
MGDERGNGSVAGMLGRSLDAFLSDGCPGMAAAIAYYTVFSLPPLLILLVSLLGVFWGAESVQGAIEHQFAQLAGRQAAAQLHTMMTNARGPGDGGVLSSVLGVAALLFGATGAFVQLQGALNRVWEVEPDPASGGVRNFLLKRLFSFGMIVGVGFLLLVSLVISAALAAFGRTISAMMPEGFSGRLLVGLNFAVSLAFITVLFAAIFRILPDARIAWRQVWGGAFATSLLFVAGKFVLGLYLGGSDPGHPYGAASAAAVLLLWTYYAGLIVLFGAELTRRWSVERGPGIRPEAGAMRVIEEKRRHPADPGPEPGAPGR